MPFTKTQSASMESQAITQEDFSYFVSPVTSITEKFIVSTSFQTPRSRLDLSIAADSSSICQDEGVNDDAVFFPPSSASRSSQPEQFSTSRNTLMSEHVRFALDDSCDSLHQFLSQSPAPETPSQSRFYFQRDSEMSRDCKPRILTFAASPSPAPSPVQQRSNSASVAESTGNEAPPPNFFRLMSAPSMSPTQFSASRRRINKRRSEAIDNDTIISEIRSSNTTSETRLTPKRRKVQEKLALSDISNNSSKSSLKDQTKPIPFSRCVSEMSGLNNLKKLDKKKVDNAIRSIDSLNLIGNSKERYSLPVMDGKNLGIPSVSACTVQKLIKGDFKDTVSDFKIIDCRYPYEFNGGHIDGAVNVYTSEHLLSEFLHPQVNQENNRAPILVFHCEFSSERAPKLAKLLREKDREINAEQYPHLHFPEIYVLFGGYSAFFSKHEMSCSPMSYVKMADVAFKEECKRYQQISKQWERHNSRTKHHRLERLASSSNISCLRI